MRLDCGYRADIIVASEVILELKSIERILPLHEAQLLTYLRLSRCRIGLLLNFNMRSLKNGIRRRVLMTQPPRSATAAPPRLLSSGWTARATAARAPAPCPRSR